MKDEILRVENLQKIYPGGVKAVDDVSFSIERGPLRD